MPKPKFYHYTDIEHAAKIEVDYTLVPGGPLNLVWLTSLPRLSLGADAIGLSAESVVQRFEVVPGELVMPWSLLRDTLPEELWWPLELAAGAQPELWYVSKEPIHVIHDRVRIS